MSSVNKPSPASPLVPNRPAEEASRLYYRLLSLSVYRGVLCRPAAASLLALLRAADAGDGAAFCGAWGQLASQAARTGAPLSRLLAGEALADENAFALAAARGENPPAFLRESARRDWAVLRRAAEEGAPLAAAALSSLIPADCLPPLPHAPDSSVSPQSADFPFDDSVPWEDQLDRVEAFHRRRGVGLFVNTTAFLWKGGRLCPVSRPDPIRLSDLKGYEATRKIAVDNTRAFLDGLEANNVLLYGDRGTGKSSTVKALLNEFAADGLRMVEMSSQSLNELPSLTDRLASVPMKFIVFIDDLSFSGSDGNFGALKAALEGGLAARPRNVLIYATSNRRHLLRETFSDRAGDEIHHADTVQESVSLSDRFGIFLTFLLPDKQHFLDMVAQMAADHGLQADPAELQMAAERWATERGGRSPRYARQFISHALACQRRGESI